VENPQNNVGDYAWLGLAAGIVAWDVFAPETMSHASRRYMEHPIFKYLWVGAIGMTALHLTSVLPHYADPFYLIHLEKDN